MAFKTPETSVAILEKQPSQNQSFWEDTRVLPLDDVNDPTFGGKFEPDFSLNNTITVAKPSDRNFPLVEPQKPKIEPLQLAENLRINPHIKEACYDVRMEMERLYRNINSGVAVEVAAEELEINLRTYDLEIIKSRPVLPHLNRFDLNNGVLRMVGNNGEPVIDAISARERSGAVLEASQSIENFLLSAENNSFAVLMNPAGWNGFTDEQGREAEPHLNTEAMIFWKDRAGELKGLTLVVDLKEEQARKTIISLGVSGELLVGKTEHERLANLVRNPALLSLPEAYINPFIYVLDQMLAQRGSGDFQLQMRQGTPEIRPVNEVRKDIERFEDLLRFSHEEEELMSEPKRFILGAVGELGEESIQQELVRKIEKVILKLTRAYLQKNEINFSYVNPTSFIATSVYAGTNIDNIQDDFSVEIAYLKTRAGCPASMAARILGGVSLGSGGESISGGTFEADQYGSLEFECPNPKCKKINRRTRGQLIPNCKYCNADVRC